MKRFSSSDSVGTMLYSHEEETSKEKLVYSSEFQAMLDSLDDEGCSEEHIIGKKRRLSIVQVHALEKIFEVDNKLDPERKVKLAQELGLQPRQVAIWFQNRRARWKTKQLERDYNILKNDYDNLQLNRNKAEEEKEKLIAELQILKKKLGEENNNESSNGKTTLVMSNDHQNIVSEQYGNGSFREHEKSSSKMNNHHEVTELMFKDGSSDSDSSGILIHEHNNLQMMNSHHHYHQQVLLSNPASCSMEYYPRPSQMVRGNHQQHSLKTEELTLFSTGLEQEPPCNIFSVDQPPNLHWYFPSDHH